MRKRTILLLLLVALLFSVSALFVGLPSPSRPGDFEGAADAALLYQWAPQIERLEESRAAWWLPGQRQARHYYYGRSGEQLIWLEVVETDFNSTEKTRERFAAFQESYSTGQLVVNSNLYMVERLPPLAENVSGFVIRWNDASIGVRFMVLRDDRVVQTTLVGIYPSNEEEQRKLLGLK